MDRRSFFAWIASLFCWRSWRGGDRHQNVVILYPIATLDRSGKTITTISMDCLPPEVYAKMAQQHGWPDLKDCPSIKNEREELIKLAGIVTKYPARIIR